MGIMMKDTFSQMHPIVNLTFFASAIILSMVIMHPVFLMISLVCALINAVYLNGRKTVLFSLKFLLPTIILVSVINPVFNHEGATIIKYLPWDNPLTLESIVYGFAAAVLLCSVVLWFSCVNTVMTSDKLIYLFGRIMPSLSLLISMTLRFVPRFISQFKSVRKAQKAIGNDISDGTILKRIKNAIKIISVLITWSLDNSIETADSMKSRGYGLKGRTAFSIFRITKRDIIWLFVILFESTLIITGLFCGLLKSRYFPTIKISELNVYSSALYFVYALLLLTPVIINVREGIIWKRLKSKI